MSVFKRFLGPFSIQRIAADAVLIALYFALSLLSVELGGLKLTFASLATILCALLYGPADGFLVGLLGAFLEQLLSKYGLTQATILWILPQALRGLTIGLFVMLFAKQFSVSAVLQRRRPFAFFALCIGSGLLVSALNTAVYYIDSKLFGYYEYHLIFGVLWLRLLSGMLSSLLMAMVAVPIAAGLVRARLVTPIRSKP